MRPSDDIKDRVSLVELVESEIKLRKDGGHFVGLCPFHSEKTGSFHVWEDHYKCFGCGAHGDIFTWTMERHGLGFREALRELAQKAGVVLKDDKEAAQEHEQHIARTALMRKAAELYHSLLTDEARAYLRGRGFTDEFVGSYLIGFAPGGKMGKLGATVGDLKAVGLVNEDGRDALFNRVVFPIWGRYADEIVGLAGRAFPDREPKYYAVPPGDAPLLGERGLRDPKGRRSGGQRFVYLCEGDPDTATLVQAGLPVVGVRGVDGFKDEFKEKFDKVDTIYVCADGDEAGTKLIHRAGMLFGNRARIVELPSGEDVNSWVGQGNDIQTRAEKAPVYIDWMLGQLPKEIVAENVDAHVKGFIPVLKGLGKTAQEAFAKKVAKALGVTVTVVREELREAVAQNGNGHAKGALEDARIIWDDKPSINPSQALVEGTMLTTVFLDKVETDPESGEQKVVTRPHVVTGRREVFELTEAAMFSRSLRYAQTKVPTASIIGQRWSTGDGSPYSVRHFIDGGCHVEPWAIYEEVVTYLRDHIDYPNGAYHDFLALWTIGTYFFELFPSYPYVHLNGTKRSGKTLTMEILSELAFNAINSASLSSAAGYRSIESCSSTLFLDEAENLKKANKKEEQPDDKLEILKAGYKRGARAIRCTGDNHEPVGFDLYSPKMFGSIGDMDETLGDRVITLTLARKRDDVKLKEFRLSEQFAPLHHTRDKLYVLMLESGHEIAERLTEGIHWEGVRDRDRELWTPVLVLAAFFDDAQIEAMGWDDAHMRTHKDEFLTSKMRLLAEENVKDRQARERLDQREVLIIAGVLEFMTEAQPIVGDFYSANALKTFLNGKDELAWIRSLQLVYRELEKMTAITKRNDLAQKRPAGAPATEKVVRCIRLVRSRIEDVANRLGVDTENVADVALVFRSDSKSATQNLAPTLGL